MKPIDVLFLCESNAALSLIAEALVNHREDPRLRAFSAGRAPAGQMLPEAREALAALSLSAEGLEPKAWTIFALPGSRRPDLVVDLATVSWADPRIADLSDAPVLRWPLRDPALARTRRERRDLADLVLRELGARIGDDLVARMTPPPGFGRHLEPVRLPA